MRTALAVAVSAALITSALAQACISLAASTTCPGFNASSISTDAQLVAYLYVRYAWRTIGLLTFCSPFLTYVSNVQTFDQQLTQYVSQGYVSSKYTTLFGCNNINLSNTTAYYARYTTSFICNSIVQNSRTVCGLTDQTARPLCADSCASFAESEETIVSSGTYCPGRSANYEDQLRADFTNCALPANSLSGTCVSGATNEPNDCGFGNNLVGLCNYCRSSTENATDSCCYTSNATGRCQDVTLPVFSSIANLFSSTTSSGSRATGTAAAGSSTNNGGGGLSGGAIAGIVIGSVLGFALLLGLIILGCIAFRKRRRNSSNGSILNQPSPQRKGGAATAMSYNSPGSQQGYEVLPGGRVARMSAMQTDDAPVVGPRQNTGHTVHTDPYGASPGSGEKVAGIVGGIKGSPESNNTSDSNDFSSPEGVASGQSEQLPFFKDYYSNDDIHPNDKVSALWAYQPRAGDEFELERGDMLKVVGIWDDGWATGVRIPDRAEDYDGKHKVQRDSGVSNGTATRDDSPASGEIKAFPLVCVCLPEAWKKTVEGDSSTDAGSASQA